MLFFLIWLSGALISYCIVFPLMHKIIGIDLDNDGLTVFVSILCGLLSWIGVISLILATIPFIPESLENKNFKIGYPKFLRKLWKL